MEVEEQKQENEVKNEENEPQGMDLSIAAHDKLETTVNSSAKDESTISEAPLKKKRKKSKKIKRSNEYPKFYRNAYVRYCDEVRPKVCEENPLLDPVEITKLVASKWYGLPKEDKQPYLDEAKIDKDRFEKELKEYQTANPDEVPAKPPTKKRKGNKAEEVPVKESPKPVKKDKAPQEAPAKKEKAVNNVTNVINQSTPVVPPKQHPIPSTSSTPSSSIIPQTSLKPSTSSAQSNSKVNEDMLRLLMAQNCEIPIFTDTFLEHNKVIESELKVLRKNNIEIEQQNSVLMKHIENMENGVVKVESEIAENRKKNMQLEVYLTKLRVILSANFNSLPIAGFKGGATIENIDKYITDLAKSSSNANLNKARDIIKKIDLQI